MIDPKDYERMVNIEMMLARISTRIKEAAAKRDISPIAQLLNISEKKLLSCIEKGAAYTLTMEEVLFLMNELKLDVNQIKI